MSDYRVSSSGHDIGLGSLTVLSPQPHSTGIQATRRTYAADGSVTDEGEYVELVFDMLPTASDYQSMLTTFGINSAITNDVTVYVRDETFTYVRKNGTAVRPQIGADVRWENMFPRGITILIRDLADAS